MEKRPLIPHVLPPKFSLLARLIKAHNEAYLYPRAILIKTHLLIGHSKRYKMLWKCTIRYKRSKIALKTRQFRTNHPVTPTYYNYSPRFFQNGVFGPESMHTDQGLTLQLIIINVHVPWLWHIPHEPAPTSHTPYIQTVARRPVNAHQRGSPCLQTHDWHLSSEVIQSHTPTLLRHQELGHQKMIRRRTVFP